MHGVCRLGQDKASVSQNSEVVCSGEVTNVWYKLENNSVPQFESTIQDNPLLGGSVMEVSTIYVRNWKLKHATT